MKKYLTFALCVFMTMYVAADDLNRSQVKSSPSPTEKQGVVADHSQDNTHVIVGGDKVGIDVVQISNEKDKVKDPTSPVIQGGGVRFGPKVPVVPGRPGTKSLGGIQIPDFSDLGWLSDGAAYGSTDSSVSHSGYLVQVSAISLSGGITIGPMGGGLVVNPPRPGFWDDFGVIGIVVSRDDAPIPLPIIIVPKNGFSRTQSYGYGERRSSCGGVNDAPVMMGDVNEDGKVDMMDVTDLISHVNGQTPERFNIKNARVAGGSESRSVDVSDVTALLDCVKNGTLPTR